MGEGQETFRKAQVCVCARAHKHAHGNRICKTCTALPFYHPREGQLSSDLGFPAVGTAGSHCKQFELVWLLPAHLPGKYLQPLDMILGLLGNELDALQDIGDVIDAPFLHLQHLSRPVQVNDTIS